MRDVIEDFFNFCAFPKTLCGRVYLLDILLSIKDPDQIEPNKILYLDVAKKHRTTQACIEKSLQTLIDKTWHHQNLVTAFRERPTSREFIIILKHLTINHVPNRSVYDILF